MTVSQGSCACGFMVGGSLGFAACEWEFLSGHRRSVSKQATTTSTIVNSETAIAATDGELAMKASVLAMSVHFQSPPV